MAAPTPSDLAAAKRLAAERLQTRRARAARMRKRVVAAAMATFVFAWGVIFVQLCARSKRSAT
jgi:cell division septal protein FtsQ